MKTKLLLPLFYIITFFSNTYAQIEFPEDKIHWKFSVEQEKDIATIIAKITCDEHWHVYAANLPEESFLLPTEIEPDASDNYDVIGKVIEPKPEFYHDEAADEDIYQHSNTFTLKRKIKIKSSEDFTLKGRFSFQTCDETHCLPPFDTNFELKIKGKIKEENIKITFPEEIIVEDSNKIKEEKSIKEDNDKNHNEITKEKPKKDKSLIIIFFLAFGSGFAALLTPCVFPMIPMTVSFFTKQSKSKSQGIRNAIIYGVSIIVIYVLLGTVVTAIFGSDALNALSTNVYFNIFFFILLVIFAISFMGAFEITLPNSWLNKADSASDKGGMIGIFFMAFTLALVSFSCTGPIVGTLLFQAAAIGGVGPVVGMLGFSLALALPFTLFAAFPGWMNTLPKSGGWLTTVKVFLGFLELALAFKFLSNADLVMDWHLLERELFLAIWIGIFGVLAIYLLGFIQLPHDNKVTNLSVGRVLLATSVIIFIIYLIPGLWGAPLKIISGFPPSKQYSESPNGFGIPKSFNNKQTDFIEGTHEGPQGIPVFHDLDKGLAYAKKVNKPTFLDFTGKACVNCRRMEDGVWGEPGVIEIMRDKVVIISLYVDDKRTLPTEEQKNVEINGKNIKITTIGKKWSVYQALHYKTSSQPYYIMLDRNGKDLTNGSADYEHHNDKDDFKAWLDKGLKLYNQTK